MKKAKLYTALPVSERRSDDRRKPIGTTVLSKNNLKTIFVLLLMIALSAPAFAVPGYKENMERIGKENIFYDSSKQSAYLNKLEKEYYERHKDGTGLNGQNYDKEVRVPYYNYSAKLQKMGYPGYDN